VSVPVEARTLIRSRKTSIFVLTLLALLLAQAAAGLHALKHFRAGVDPAGLPGQHAQLCMECASFAPLAGAHGGPATSLVAAFLPAEQLRPLARSPLTGQAFQASYRTRAPPR
jgi:hypothetical protein